MKSREREREKERENEESKIIAKELIAAMSAAFLIPRLFQCNDKSGQERNWEGEGKKKIKIGR